MFRRVASPRPPPQRPLLRVESMLRPTGPQACWVATMKPGCRLPPVWPLSDRRYAFELPDGAPETEQDARPHPPNHLAYAATTSPAANGPGENSDSETTPYGKPPRRGCI